MSSKGFGILMACIAVLAGRARAEPFWIAYEADDGRFPEEVGWERITYGGGDARWFEDGALVLDGRASIEIADLYQIQRPLEPGPDELFVMEWRLRVDELSGVDDPGISIGSSGDGVVTLTFSESSIYSWYEGTSIDFSPGSFHDYRFTSPDMLTYRLYLDGQLVHTGSFVGPWYSSKVMWGDAVLGASSLAAWDFARFGVVPEPAGALLIGCAGLPVIHAISRQRRRSFS